MRREAQSQESWEVVNKSRRLIPQEKHKAMLGSSWKKGSTSQVQNEASGPENVHLLRKHQ